MGIFPQGESPYAAHEMSGNVWEWTADWYDSDYYANSPDRNPTGPESGDYRTLRGGSWNDFVDRVRCAVRLGGLSGRPPQRLRFALVSPGAVGR